jgi:hypothetical protein
MIPLTQSKTLANTNDHTTSDEDADVSTRRKRLHECCDNDKSSSNGHSNTTPSIISKGTSHEETGYNSTDCIAGIDCTYVKKL